MICRHCGKEYSDEFAYCPYCAEPVERPKVEFTNTAIQCAAKLGVRLETNRFRLSEYK